MSNTIINGGASPYPKHVGPAAICSFSDGAQDAPLKSLKFYIEPQQDLHGYSYPWPAGSTKNQMPGFDSGLWGTANTSGWTIGGYSSTPVTFPVSLSASQYQGVPAIKFKLKPSTTYYITGISPMYWCGSFYDSSNTKLGSFPSATHGGTFTTPANTDYAIFALSNYQAAARTLSTSMQIQVEEGETETSYIPYSNICPISGWSQVDGKQSGEDMTDYTPITISLGQTVYGGYVDAISGKLTITKVHKLLKDLTISLNTAYSNTFNLTGATDRKVEANVTTEISNVYKMYTSTGIGGAGVTSGFAFSNTNTTIFVRDARATTGTELLNLLTSEGAEVVYRLATPIEVDLTPVSVSSQLGQNNVWANTGDTELDYYPAAASVVAVLNKSSKVYTSIPLGKIRYDTYQTTPNQALDLDSYRAETGVLIRNVLSHTATKIEFNTPSMTNAQWEEVWNIIKAGFNNSTERKLKLKYYDQMSATYKTGWFYVPDVQFTIRNIDEAAGIINYDEVRVAFIEY